MSSVDDVLKELRQKIEKMLPPEITITDIEFEGPELVVYSNNTKAFAETGNLVKKLAKDIRKRIVIRPDAKLLISPEKAIEIIK
ncbi:MAG: beta-CASP ribonuclease aCPSF1, partial [Methermicoccaceae archaeon]